MSLSRDKKKELSRFTYTGIKYVLFISAGLCIVITLGTDYCALKKEHKLSSFIVVFPFNGLFRPKAYCFGKFVGAAILGMISLYTKQLFPKHFLNSSILPIN